MTQNWNVTAHQPSNFRTAWRSQVEKMLITINQRVELRIPFDVALVSKSKAESCSA